MRVKGRPKGTFWDEVRLPKKLKIKFYVRRKQKPKKRARRKISFLAKKQIGKRHVSETEPPKVSFIARPLKKV